MTPSLQEFEMNWAALYGYSLPLPSDNVTRIWTSKKNVQAHPYIASETGQNSPTYAFKHKEFCEQTSFQEIRTMSRSNIQFRGQRRGRSLEPPTPPGPRTPSPDGPTLVTRSLHANRTIKKGKVSDKHTQKPHARDRSHQPAKSTSTEPRSRPTERPGRASTAQATLEVLTSRLEDALHTIEIIAHPDLAQLGVDPTRQVLTRCHKPLVLKASSREAILHTEAEGELKKLTTSSHTGEKTYAQATAYTKSSHIGLQRQSKTRPRASRHHFSRNVDFVRLIVDFRDKCGKRPRPFRLRDYLNQQIHSLDVKFEAAKFSAAGNLILTIASPKARHLQTELEFLCLVRVNIAHVLELKEDDNWSSIRIYPDKPWHRVVINRISLKDARKAAKTSDADEITKVMWDELKNCNPHLPRLLVSIPLDRSFRLLVREQDDLSKRETVSICIAFDDVKIALKMVQDGAFVFGKHRKVSWYRSRSWR
ncbi:hypothetical protein CVT26_006968 [Gymnopilus dilepis]|uniref:Uncharacterized protein n=1 Tax=Gymnopilus dilepis TaxID=231916 RepID=A0A409WQJ2_9AGAR|nr:hypothetical protein CVT26_006968 [Gymnopilus dilepis]